MSTKNLLSEDDFENSKDSDALIKLINNKNISYSKVRNTLIYNKELRNLQIELVKLQRYISSERSLRTAA